MALPPTAESEKREANPADPLESLHRMSRTAGVGTQDYVAVNPAAVGALLLGLLSSAAVVSDVLLVVPVAAVIVSVVALVQVKGSGGTQTGKGLAIVGLALALVFVGWVGGHAWMKQRAIRAEQGEIVALLDQLSKNVTSKDYDAAWQQFGSVFRSQVRKHGFIDTWKSLDSLSGYGPIKGLRWNTLLDIQIDPNTGVKLANGVILIDTSSGVPDRWPAVFRKDAERGWLIENVDTDYFPRQAAIPEERQPTPILPQQE